MTYRMNKFNKAYEPIYKRIVRKPKAMWEDSHFIWHD